jgi:hypothetical protein
MNAARAQKGGAFVASALTHAAGKKLDLENGTLALGFAPEQFLYREKLENSDTQSVILKALRECFGRDFKLTINKISADAGETSVVGTANDTLAGTTDGPESHEETTVEFDGTDELPLGSNAVKPPAPRPQELPVQQRQSIAPAQGSSANKPSGAKAPAFVPPARGDIKIVEDHPLVKQALKEIGGVVMSVTQRVAKNAAAPDGKV